MQKIITNIIVKLTVKYMNKTQAKRIYEASLELIEARERANKEMEQGNKQAKEILLGKKTLKIDVVKKYSKAHNIIVKA